METAHSTSRSSTSCLRFQRRFTRWCSQPWMKSESAKAKPGRNVLLACVSLSAFFGAGLVPMLHGSDYYLPRFGPVPLRFAAIPRSAKDFIWPSLGTNSNSVTNSANIPPVVISTPDTNAVVTTAASTIVQTNAMPDVPGFDNTASGPLMVMPTAGGTPANSLTASNLLVVTPQMLADYFKSNLDISSKPSTNSFGGGEVMFNPPTPRIPPSSEAVYRVQ
jgi:hypothetical protein